MGTGKTTVGRHLAVLLKKPFVEMDKEIETFVGMSINEIFEKMGEKYFREKETEVLENIVKGPEAVVSTGGGVVIKQYNRQLMRAHGTIICLWAGVDTIVERLSGSKDRPLLNVKEPDKTIRHLLQVRKPYYMDADLHIKTDGKSPYELALEIKEQLTASHDIR